MRTVILRGAATAILVLTSTAAGCGFAGLRQQRATPTPVSLQTNLDTVFSSPTGLYTLRYNHSWAVQRIDSQAGGLDVFTLPNATISVEAERVPAGTKLDALIDQTLQQYKGANIQGIERAGAIDVGGGHGELVKATTYVNAQGVTVASAPSPSSKPRNLYQAFYLAGTLRFTFSVAWPQGIGEDYLPLFRAMMQTFTLAGTS